MEILDTVVINSDVEKEEVVEIVGKACDYFPSNSWDGIQYKGSVHIPYDLKIIFNGSVYKSFLWNMLLRKTRQLKKENRLLGITFDPILLLDYSLQDGNIKKNVFFVFDYMTNDVGFVSLFFVKRDVSNKIIAHTLGHSKNLEHHDTPTCLMYSRLQDYLYQINSFCKSCIKKL